MTAFDFSKHVIETCSRYQFLSGVEILLLDEPVTKIKALIDGETHIAIF